MVIAELELAQAPALDLNKRDYSVSSKLSPDEPSLPIPNFPLETTLKVYFLVKETPKAFLNI